MVRWAHVAGAGIAACLLMLFGSACGSSDSSDSFDKSAICGKCAACHQEDPSFSEGFCDPFWNGTTFDKDACIKNGNPAELRTKPSASDLAGMTCTQFDNAV